MAIYQNKEVQIDAYPELRFVDAKYKVTFQDGSVAAVDASDIQLTDEEKKIYDNRIKESYLNSPTVDSKKLKEIRDARQKSVEEKQEGMPAYRAPKVK